MASPNHTVVVSVLGLSRLDGENFGSHKGIGKSCLCSRFMYPGYDDYQHDSHSHCSLLAMHEFEGDVVHKDPFLYWGSTTRTYDAKCMSVNVHFEVLEHTVFYEDVKDRPFRISSSKKPVSSLDGYMKVVLTNTLISLGKLSYKSRDIIFSPQEYDCVALPFGIEKHRRGFVVAIDVSDSGPKFESRLHLTEKTIAHLASRKQKFVVAATKSDEAFATSLEKLKELARTRKFTLIEVSAKANVNVSEAFEIVAAKVLGFPTHVLPFGDAALKTLSNLNHAKRSFRTYLQKRVTVSSESLKTLQCTEEYRTCAQYHGKFETNKMFAHHVLTLRNDEVSTYAGVMDSEEMRQKFLEDYLAERKDLSPHATHLGALIIKICQMCSSKVSIFPSPTTPRHMPLQRETSPNNFTVVPISLISHQDSNQGSDRPLPPVPPNRYCPALPPPLDITTPASPSSCQMYDPTLAGSYSLSVPNHLPLRPPTTPTTDGLLSKDVVTDDLLKPKALNTGNQINCDSGDYENAEEKPCIPEHLRPTPLSNLFPDKQELVYDYPWIPGTVRPSKKTIPLILGGSGVLPQNVCNGVPGENQSWGKMHSDSEYNLIGYDQETQDLNDDVRNAEISDYPTDWCPYESDEELSTEGQCEADNCYYSYVSTNNFLRRVMVWSDSDDDEYVPRTEIEMSDEEDYNYINALEISGFEMASHLMQPTTPLHQPSPQLKPLSAELQKPCSELQDPSAPLQEPSFQLQQPTQEEEKKEKLMQPLNTQGNTLVTPMALSDVTIVDSVATCSSSLNRLGGSKDQFGIEDSLMPPLVQTTKQPQALRVKPLVSKGAVLLIQSDVDSTAPPGADSGRSVGGDNDFFAFTMPASDSTISKPVSENGDNLTEVLNLGDSKAIPTEPIDVTIFIQAKSTLNNEVEKPGLAKIREKLKKEMEIVMTQSSLMPSIEPATPLKPNHLLHVLLKPATSSPITSSQMNGNEWDHNCKSVPDTVTLTNKSTTPWHGPGIPTGEIHDTTSMDNYMNADNNSNDDFALCNNCGINWVPQDKNCMSDVKPLFVCQICALSEPASAGSI